MRSSPAPTEISEFLVAIYVLINASEWLYLQSKPSLLRTLEPDAIFLRLQDRGVPTAYAARLSNLFQMVGLKTPAVALLISGFVLLFALLTSHMAGAATVAVALCLFAFNSTVGFGLEGADQMAILVLFTNSLITLLPKISLVSEAFIAAQLILSYAVAGVAKALSREWRSGEALIMILSTLSFGYGSAKLPVRAGWFAQLLCLSVITFELAWLGAPFSMQLAVALMCLGIIFHFANAWIMGLNLFPWAFVSAYPLAFDAITRVHGVVGNGTQ